jgi:hypothetical protein
MLRSLMLAIILVIAPGEAATRAPTHITAQHVRHICTLTHCGHCPKGEWRCNGKCIPKDQACRLIR